MFQVGQRIQCTIENLTDKYVGQATVQGEIIRVPDTWPGDRVECTLTALSRQHGHWFAVVHRMVQPGMTRVKPPCAVQAICPGCPWMVISLQAQNQWKKSLVQEILPSGEFHAANPLGFRNKVKWAVHGNHGRTTMGILHPQKRRLVPAASCAVLVPALNRLHTELSEIIRPLPAANTPGGLLRAVFAKVVTSGDIAVTFVVKRLPDAREREILSKSLQCTMVRGVTCNVHPKETNRLAGTEEFLLAGSPFLKETDLPCPIFVNATCFSQTHHAMAKKAVELITGFCQGSWPILDLFCGVGPTAGALALKGLPVRAVEMDPVAIDLARKNQAPVEWFCQDVHDFIQKPEGHLDGKFRLIVNPPRQGLSQTLRNWILSKKPETLTYMSCNIHTLQRDYRFLEQDGYRAVEVHGLDMFPHTPWFETVLHLVLQ